MALSTIPTRALTEQGINFRNLIINGDMSIAQRGTSFSLTSGNNKFPVDRFKVFTEGSYAYTVSQSTDVPTGQGFTNSIKVDVTTANASPSTGDQSLLYYNVEGLHLQHLKKGTSNAESVTLSFWVKSTATGNMQVNLRDLDNARIIGNTITVNSANTWEKKTLTFEGDTTGAFANDNGASLRVTWMLGSGSTYTSGAVPTSWEAFSNGDKNAGDTMNFSSSASNDLYITGVQLEVGTSASDFEFLPFDVNLRRCQRYYQKSFNYEYAPQNVSSYSGGFSDAGNGTVMTSTRFKLQIYFRDEMRSAPTIVYYKAQGVVGDGEWSYWDGADNLDNTSMSADTRANKFTATMDFSGGGKNVGRSGMAQGNWTAEAEL